MQLQKITMHFDTKTRTWSGRAYGRFESGMLAVVVDPRGWPTARDMLDSLLNRAEVMKEL